MRHDKGLCPTRNAAPADSVRSSVSGRRPGALDDLLPEAWFYVRRAVGRVLRDWRAGRVGVHLKEAPKNPAERQHRREHEHLDAAAGIDGIEAFYDQCIANGATIVRPLTVTAWGTKDFYIEDPDGYIIGFGGRPAKNANAELSDAPR